ncbi:MAG: energy transducer TonB [Flavobacteriales bacterium]|nr:energy transducer TonB [Flavobacteriales bacterium]
MENKKSKSADLEKKRTSTILVGMVCASSLVLMSFEYAEFELKQESNLMAEAQVTKEIWEVPYIEVFKPSAPAPTPKIKITEYVKVDNEVVESENEEIVLEESDDLVFDVPDAPDGFGPRDDGPVIDSLDEGPQIPDVMPEFPGGKEEMYKYLSKQIVFPDEIKNIGIQGKVYIQFTVEKDGSITDIEVVKTPHSKLGKVTYNAVSKMPTWIPGIKNNKPVSVRYTLPVNFQFE